MRSLVGLLALALSGSASPADVRQDHELGPEMVDYINGLGTTWKAGRHERFEAMEPEDRQRMNGGRLMDPEARKTATYSDTQNLDITIPKYFDARAKWPDCPSISLIRDQSQCGSCWAFGAVEAMSDRVCIASQGKHQVTLSADDMLSCCTGCMENTTLGGCSGGYQLAAWQYWVANGTVTGSGYWTNQGCKPYPIPPRAPKNTTSPACTQQCASSSNLVYSQDKVYGNSSYLVGKEGNAPVAAVQKEIMTRGPVQTWMMVYEDLYTYKTGVYSHQTGKAKGGHFVRIIGWGEEFGIPYWLIANSWNTDWGDSGFFKIRRGVTNPNSELTGECGIETEVAAGMPRMGSSPMASASPSPSPTMTPMSTTSGGARRLPTGGLSGVLGAILLCLLLH